VGTDVLFLADDGSVFGIGKNSYAILGTGDKRSSTGQALCSKLLTDLQPVRLYGIQPVWSADSGEICVNGAALLTSDGRPFFWGFARPIPVPMPTMEGRNIYSLTFAGLDTALVATGREEPVRARRTNARSDLPPPEVRLVDPTRPISAWDKVAFHAAGTVGAPCTDDFLIVHNHGDPIPEVGSQKSDRSRVNCSGYFVTTISIESAGLKLVSFVSSAFLFAINPIIHILFVGECAVCIRKFHAHG